MDLRLRLEGASAAAEEVAQLREREGQLRQELEDAQQSLSQKQVCPGTLACEKIFMRCRSYAEQPMVLQWPSKGADLQSHYSVTCDSWRLLQEQV